MTNSKVGFFFINSIRISESELYLLFHTLIADLDKFWYKDGWKPESVIDTFLFVTEVTGKTKYNLIISKYSHEKHKHETVKSVGIANTFDTNRTYT